jgi:uncharacterized membrane protein
MKKTEFLTKKALESRTPTWAKNAFRITFVVTSALTLFLAGTQIIEENVKFELMLALKSIDAFVLGVSKMFGVTEEEN